MAFPTYEFFDKMAATANGADIRAFVSENLTPATPEQLTENFHWTTISLLIEGSFGPIGGHDIARRVRGALWPQLEQSASPQAREGDACPRRPVSLLDLLWNEIGRLPRGRDIPKPWVLRAFRRENDDGHPQAVVQFVLYGLASSYCELIADLLVNAFEDGLGDWRRAWRLVDHEIVSDEGLNVRRFKDRAWLKLLSPLTLSKQGAESTDMRNLLPGLIDRVEGLGRWHGLKLDCDFGEMRRVARSVELADEQTSRHSWVRKSSRAGGIIPMTDTRGVVELRGNLGPLAPFLSLLPVIHAGKDTRHGHGWIRVES